MKLKGADDLEDRLKAIQKVPREVSARWGENYVRVARPMIPSRSGKTRRSLQVGRRRGSTVVLGSFILFFLDAGTKEHVIPRQYKRKRRKAGPVKTLMFQGHSGTVFAKKVDHPRTDAHPFRERAMEESFRREPMSVTLIRLWNKAA